jgi:iron(III) transport system substrate-binding protein
MKKLAIVLVVSLAACKAHPHKERPRLSLYCSAQIEWCQLMTNEFEQRTGIKVSMTRKSSGETYAQVWAERKNPKGDVWWAGTGDAHIQAADAKLTEPYRSPLVDELHDWAKDPTGTGESRTTGIYMGVLGFGYNTEWLASKHLAAPRTWSDLADPAYRGEIQMANPSSSGTAYTLLATILSLYGEERGWDYLRKLHANVNQYTKSGAAPISSAARGETGIGIVFLHDAMTQKTAGFPIEVVAPSEGTGYEIGCVSIIHGARHPDNAKRFVDFALTKGAQELGARAGAFQFPSNRSAELPSSMPRPSELKRIDYDYRMISKKETRLRILERWEREVKSADR